MRYSKVAARCSIPKQDESRRADQRSRKNCRRDLYMVYKINDADFAKLYPKSKCTGG